MTNFATKYNINSQKFQLWLEDFSPVTVNNCPFLAVQKQKQSKKQRLKSHCHCAICLNVYTSIVDSWNYSFNDLINLQSTSEMLSLSIWKKANQSILLINHKILHVMKRINITLTRWLLHKAYTIDTQILTYTYQISEFPHTQYGLKTRVGRTNVGHLSSLVEIVPFGQAFPSQISSCRYLI
jgi:hypothetical protein